MPAYSTDIELFSAFHNGEHAAIQQVYQLHYKPLTYYAHRITGSAQEAQDMVADCFIKLLQNRESFLSLSNVKSFLYLSTKNACIDRLRTLQTHQRIHERIRNLDAEDRVAEERELEGESIRLEVLASIHAEIENLTDRKKEVFKLIFLEELSTAEVAEHLGISAQTVLNLKSQALQMIRSELLKKGNLTALIFLAALFPTRLA